MDAIAPRPRGRADGGSRTHTLRFTKALLDRLSFAGLSHHPAKYPRQESNLLLPVPETGVLPAHPGDVYAFTYALGRPP